MTELVNIHNITVDIKSKITKITIPTFVQYDNVRLVITVNDNTKRFDVSNATNVEFAHKRLDGMTVVGQGRVEDNKIVYDYAGSEMEIIGVVKTSFSMISGSRRVSVQPFDVEIKKNLIEDIVSPAEPAYNALQSLIVEVENLSQGVSGSATFAQTQGNYAKTQADYVASKKPEMDYFLGAQTNLETQVRQVVQQVQANNLTYKESYATLSALQTAYPTGNVYNHVVLADGMIYTWTNNVWTNTQIQANGTGLPNETVTPVKTTFFKSKGINLFNKDTISKNKYINYETGGTLNHASYCASDYIPVTPNKTYIKGTAFRNSHFAYYTSEKVYISNTNNTINSTFTVPSNAYYIRLTLTDESSVENAMLMEGTFLPSSYIPFFEFTKGYLPDIEVDKTIGTLPAVRTDMLEKGKNLFDKSRAISGYIDGGHGAIKSHATYYSSDFIEIEAGESYYLTGIMPQHLAWFDENKTYISGFTSPTTNPIVAPTFAKYIRFTINQTNLNIAQFEKGTAGTAYEKFKEPKIKGTLIPEIDISNTKGVLPVDRTDFVELGKNLFDKSRAISGYIDGGHGHGAIKSHATYYSSDFIEIEAGESYYLTGIMLQHLAWFDENKTYISGFTSPTTNPIVAPTFAKYIRFTINQTNLNIAQFEQGEEATEFEEYGVLKVKKSLLPSTLETSKDEFLLFLPSEICIAVGRTIELYNRQVCWTGNINNYHFKWQCAVGKAMKRKWTFTGVTDKIGNHTLTCTVYDNNMKQVATASTTIKVVAATIPSNKKILPIGDSLSNIKPWMQEVINLSNDKINYVGTRWNGDVKGGKRNHEGRSGATSAWYLANSTYTYEMNGETTGNPFWNPSTSKFDFNYYKTTYDINPDIVQIFLGTNGITLDPTTNANNIKGIVDGIRLSDANIPIYVAFTLYRGDQNGLGNQLSSDGYSAGSGVWKLEEDRKVFNLMVKVNELLKNYTNLFFIPIALTHDSEYNFQGTTATPVNPRSTITEYIHSEATHPSATTAGYLQMADIMFSTFAVHITS